MTEKQALTRARKRWGKRAHVQTGPGERGQEVGYIWLGPMFMIEGSGPTWAEAFEQADENGAKHPSRPVFASPERA